MGAEILELRPQQEARFTCSYCGADRYCDCNAPALEKLAEMKEAHRQAGREHMRRSRELKREEKQRPVDINTRARDRRQEKIDESNMRNAFMMNCGLAVKMARQKYPGVIDAAMVDAVRQAADAWQNLLAELEHVS